MIDAAILAAIEARLGRALADDGIARRPLYVDGVAVGLVDDERAARLARFDAFRAESRGIALDARLATCEARSTVIAEIARVLRAEGALPAWRDELYAVASRFGAPPLLRIERGAARYFGVRTWAAHVNGLVRGEPPRMWLARRSPRKAVDPGLLDNLVGGGIAAGLTVEETVLKEAWEEAGIPPALARGARPAGIVHVRRRLFDGLQRETLFAHDLWLPASFAPRNQDGEAVEHRLVDFDEAARTIAQSRGPYEATLDASVVALDCLMRHREFSSDAPAFTTLAALRGECP